MMQMYKEYAEIDIRIELILCITDSFPKFKFTLPTKY